jgi:hypothetical protein
MNWEKEALFNLQRRAMLLEEAEQSRLAQEAKAYHVPAAGMVASAMIQTGHTLVAIGERLIAISGQPSRNPVKTRYNADNSLAL